MRQVAGQLGQAQCEIGLGVGIIQRCRQALQRRKCAHPHNRAAVQTAVTVKGAESDAVGQLQADIQQ